MQRSAQRTNASSSTGLVKPKSVEHQHRLLDRPKCWPPVQCVFRPKGETISKRAGRTRPLWWRDVQPTDILSVLLFLFGIFAVLSSSFAFEFSTFAWTACLFFSYCLLSIRTSMPLLLHGGIALMPCCLGALTSAAVHPQASTQEYAEVCLSIYLFFFDVLYCILCILHHIYE